MNIFEEVKIFERNLEKWNLSKEILMFEAFMRNFLGHRRKALLSFKLVWDFNDYEWFKLQLLFYLDLKFVRKFGKVWLQIRRNVLSRSFRTWGVSVISKMNLDGNERIITIEVKRDHLHALFSSNVNNKNEENP